MSTTQSPHEAKLADPVDVLDLPRTVGPNDLHSAIVDSSPRRNALPVLAAGAVLTAAVTVAISVAPGGADHASAVVAAAEATSAVDSGRLVVEQQVVGDGGQLDQVIVLDFAGDDYRISFTNRGGVITGDGSFTPESMEVRSVDGAGFIKIGNDPWHETVSHPTYEALGDVSGRLTAAARAAEDLDRCDSADGSLEAYCFATNNVELVHVLRPASTLRFASIDAQIRVEVDTTSGTIAAIAVDASDAIVDPDSHPGEFPVLDLSSTTTFIATSDSIEIVAPEIRTAARPTSLTPAEAFNPIVLGMECRHLHEQNHPDEVITCLRNHGFNEVAEYYASVFEIETKSGS